MKLKIFQVDAFTRETFRGNPAAVVPLQEWLPEDVMLAIAAENNLSETAFFVDQNERYEIRWFTPAAEVALCGHATLASAHVIFNELGLEKDAIKFHSPRSGELGVTKDGDRLVLDFPSHPMTEIEPIASLASEDPAPRKFFESQGNMLFLLMDSQQIVADLRPDMRLIEELPYDEIIFMAKGEDCDFVSRMFAPRLGVPEDPVTGSTHCSLIPYWAERLGKNELFARQISKRGGELFCALAGERVKIGGEAVTYLKGEIALDGLSRRAFTN